MPGFGNDGSGGCKCPTGKQNVDGVCIDVQTDSLCTHAEVTANSLPMDDSSSTVPLAGSSMLLVNLGSGDAIQAQVVMTPMQVLHA